MSNCAEIGTVPGTYRIMDLFCFREVLNQIMKCSCQSDLGFAMYQNVEENSQLTFHSVLDIVCRNCQQKVSFGTSVLTGKHEKNQMQSDVDARLNRFFGLLGATSNNTSLSRAAGFQALWRELNNSSGVNGTASSGLASPAASTTPTPATIAGLVIRDNEVVAVSSSPHPPRMVDFVTGGDPDEEVVVCYTCHNIFSGAEFAEHEASACAPKTAVVAAAAPTVTSAHNQTEHTCTECGKAFAKLFNLKQHTRIHTGERPFHCAHCSRCFADRSSMNKHVRTVHELRRPHQCAVCRKGFPSTSHLNDHMVTHSKEKNFMCQFCQRAFSFRTSLKKHLLTHTEGKPFKCKVCLKNFKSRSSIKAHMEKVHQLPLTRFNCESSKSWT